MRFITFSLIFLLTSQILWAHSEREISPFDSMSRLYLLEQHFGEEPKSQVSVTKSPHIGLYLYPRFSRSCKLLFEARERNQHIIHQGDIVLGPVGSVQDVTGDLDGQSEANRLLVAGLGLKLLDRSAYAWPDGIIPYTIDEELKDIEKTILQAIKEWNDKTNVTFVHYELEENWLRNHFGYNAKIWRIHFVASKDNCSSSYVGLRKISLAGKVRAQPVWLSKNSRRDTVLHELGHTIGLWHEHNRPDRDQFIKIMEKNIQKDHLDQFAIDSESQIGDYDFLSIMHYSQSIFANDSAVTFSFNDGMTNVSAALVGNVQNISDGDIEAVNAIYPQQVYHAGPFVVPGDEKNESNGGASTGTLSEVDYTDLEIDEGYYRQLKTLVVDHLKIADGDVADIECKRAPVGTLDIIKCVVTLKNKKKYAASIHAGTGSPYVMFIKEIH